MKSMKIYYDDGTILIRSMRPDDAKILYDTYDSYGWAPLMETFLAYYRDQEEGNRLVFIAEYKGALSGQCVLDLHPKEGPWAGGNYPEIMDLTVFYSVHGKGIGTRLLDAAETEAARFSDMVFLAVGLHSGYGPAQRMYARRGYIPDGSGAWYRGKALEPYASCANDDELLLYLSKQLG